jgi:hypothetical protein
MLANCEQARNFRKILKLKEAGTTTANFRMENIAMWKERLSLATEPLLSDGHALGKFYG